MKCCQIILNPLVVYIDGIINYFLYQLLFKNRFMLMDKHVEYTINPAYDISN